jgi:pimeloyl-ACP methyl ester carboxylesterase
MDHDLQTGGQSVHTGLGGLRVLDMGSGPPAVLWHSLFVDSSTWQRVLDPLAEQRRLILIDGPGHGLSDGPARSFTLDECAGAACDILDKAGIDEPVDWVGNAWGGHVGIVFAASRPGRCRSLVTIGAPVHPLSPSEHRLIAASRALYRLVGPARPIVKGITDALLGPHSDPADAMVVAEAFRRSHRRGMSNAISSISLRRQDLTPTLTDVQVPTLMIAGVDDKMWLPAQAESAARRLPNGASASLPGGGHVAPLLRAAPALVELLTEFWQAPATFVTRHPGSTTQARSLDS